MFGTEQLQSLDGSSTGKSCCTEIKGSVEKMNELVYIVENKRMNVQSGSWDEASISYSLGHLRMQSEGFLCHISR